MQHVEQSGAPSSKNGVCIYLRDVVRTSDMVRVKASEWVLGKNEVAGLFPGALVTIYGGQRSSDGVILDFLQDSSAPQGWTIDAYLSKDELRTEERPGILETSLSQEISLRSLHTSVPLATTLNQSVACRARCRMMELLSLEVYLRCPSCGKQMTNNTTFPTVESQNSLHGIILEGQNSALSFLQQS